MNKFYLFIYSCTDLHIVIYLSRAFDNHKIIKFVKNVIKQYYGLLIMVLWYYVTKIPVEANQHNSTAPITKETTIGVLCKM